jgi:hypothetical protein
MKRDIGRRLARLEAKLLKSPAKKVDEWGGFKWALMAIVAIHAGEMSAGDSFMTALAGGLGMAGLELKDALRPDHDGPDLWTLVLEKLNDLATARGGRPIAENGSPILEGPGEGDDRRNGFDVLDELYQEIPDEIRKRYNLLPFLADYIKNAIGADKDN